jgi:hypothetical protein
MTFILLDKQKYATFPKDESVFFIRVAVYGNSKFKLGITKN